MALQRPPTPPQPPLALRDLTLPVGDTTTLRRLIARDVRRWSEALRGLPLLRVAEADRPAFVAAVAALRELERTAPSRAAALLRLPTIAVLVELCLRQRDAVAGGESSAVAAYQRQVRELAWLLLAELAAAGAPARDAAGAQLRLQLPIRGLPPLALLGAGVAVAFAPAARAVTFADAALHVEGPAGTATVALGVGAREASGTSRDGTSRDGTSHDAVSGTSQDRTIAGEDSIEGLAVVTRPWTPIRPGLLLAGIDNSPLWQVEAHPDKEGNALDLGGRPAADWADSIGAAVDLVARYLPLLAEEMRLLLRLCIPVGVDDEKHLSASFQEYIGAIYLTLHPNAMTMTEALIHEFQHNKINAAFHIDPLLRNAFWPLVSSPVRPDPRPLHGVVLAVHAFQPVARLYQRMHEDGHPWAANPAWQRRAAAVFAKIHEGATTVLTRAEPTPLGVEVLAEMARLDRELMAFAAEVGWVDAAAGGAAGDEP